MGITTYKQVTQSKTTERIYRNTLKYKKNIFIIIICLYIFSIILFYPKFHYELFKINIIPIIFAAFFFGFKTGLLTVVSQNLFLFAYLIINKQPFNIKNIFTGVILCLGLSIIFSVIAKVQQQILGLNEELKEMSLKDSLTGLRNRRYLNEVVSDLADNFIEEMVNEEVRKRDLSLNNKVLGICLIDIDFFKKVNDTYGHQVGDIVLKEISAIMKNLVRFDDIVIRWGGEEFFILLNRTQKEFLPDFLQLLKARIANHHFMINETQSIKITVSGGCIAYPYYKDTPDRMSFEECINISDMLLYQAKKFGRDRLILLKPTNKVYNYNELKDLLSIINQKDFDENNMLEIY